MPEPKETCTNCQPVVDTIGIAYATASEAFRHLKQVEWQTHFQAEHCPTGCICLPLLQLTSKVNPGEHE